MTDQKLEHITVKELAQFGLTIPLSAFDQMRGDYDVKCCWGAHCAQEYYNEESYEAGINALTWLLKCSESTLNALHIKAGLRVKPFGSDDWNVAPHQLFKNMEKLDIRKLTFEGEDLRHANFEAIKLMEQDFQGADLRGANLKGARLERTDFRGANLRGADLRDADLEFCDLEGVDLYGAIYNDRTVIDYDAKVDMFRSRNIGY